jgi:hypothetical protein
MALAMGKRQSIRSKTPQAQVEGSKKASPSLPTFSVLSSA